MKKIALAAATLALAAGALFGCSTSTTGGTILGTNATADFSGNTLTITLPSNPTTGYAWSYTVEGDNLENTADSYAADETANNVSGAGGTQVYVFAATGAGDATINLDYARSWEESADDLHYVVKITADGSSNITSLVTEDNSAGETTVTEDAEAQNTNANAEGK